MSLKYEFSKALLHAREDMGYTQSAVAEAVSVSVRWYQKVEAGHKLPGAVTMLRLILFLNIDVKLFRDEVGLVDPVPTARMHAIHR